MAQQNKGFYVPKGHQGEVKLKHLSSLLILLHLCCPTWSSLQLPVENVFPLVWIVVTVTLWPNAVTWGVLKSINKWATEILWKPGARQLWDEVSQNPEHLFSITQLEKVKSCLKTHQHYCKHLLLPESTKNPLAKSIGVFLPRRCFRLAVFKHLTHSLDMA